MKADDYPKMTREANEALMHGAPLMTAQSPIRASAAKLKAMSDDELVDLLGSGGGLKARCTRPPRPQSVRSCIAGRLSEDRSAIGQFVQRLHY